MILNAFNQQWAVRSGLEGGQINYTPLGVTAKTTTITLPDGTRNKQRIVLDASQGSVAVQLPTYLGFGTYTATLQARLDGLDPALVATCWLHDDDNVQDPQRLELDWEHTCWGDPNTPFRHHLGILRGPAVREGQVQQDAATAYTLYRVSLTMYPSWQSAKVEGYRPADGQWVVVSFRRWDVSAPRAGRFKVGLWWSPSKPLPKNMCVDPMLTITNFQYTP